MTKNPSVTSNSASAISTLAQEDARQKKGVDLLILGAGWTAGFLIPMIIQWKEGAIRWAATTRDGHNDTIPFTFDPASKDEAPYKSLPLADTVLITFPLKGSGQSQLLTNLYHRAHPGSDGKTNWIQLGSTGVYKEKGWSDFRSPYDKLNDRAIAEDELLALHGDRACILTLAGLYGGQRQLRHWLPRVARNKEAVAAKGAVHMVHGNDVSRAIIGAHESLCGQKAKQSDPIIVAGTETQPSSGNETNFPTRVGGRRWPVTDLHCYDWWDLFMQFGSYAREHAAAGGVDPSILKGTDAAELKYEEWVLELMDEQQVKALPRDKADKGIERLVDGRAFWTVVGLWPIEGRADRRE